MSEETKIANPFEVAAAVAKAAHLLEDYNVEGLLQIAKGSAEDCTARDPAWPFSEQGKALNEVIEAFEAAVPLVALARKIRERMGQGG